MNDVEISRLMDGIPLGRGAHISRDHGMCAMEMIAYITGGEHSFEPACVSELLSAFTIRLNDHMQDAERQALKPFLPRLVGSTDGDERARFEAMSRTAIRGLFAPLLAQHGAEAAAAELERAADRPLREAVLAFRGLRRANLDPRLRKLMSRDVAKALAHAVEAAERRRYGLLRHWNWCGGELGHAVATASRVAGDWSAALQVLEAGIDAAPGDEPRGTPATPSPATPSAADEAAPPRLRRLLDYIRG